LINSFSKFVAQKLGLDMSMHDIERSRVIGKVTNGKSQVTFKFLSYRMRNTEHLFQQIVLSCPPLFCGFMLKF
jgi:hypothetical protein